MMKHKKGALQPGLARLFFLNDVEAGVNGMGCDGRIRLTGSADVAYLQ
jgi:hypothetical protein